MDDSGPALRTDGRPEGDRSPSAHEANLNLELSRLPFNNSRLKALGNRSQRRRDIRPNRRPLFLRLRRWAEANGSALYVTTTGWHRPPYDQGPAEPTRAFMAVAARFFEEAGIAYADVLPEVLAIRRRAPELYIIPADGHPNERGSELIASAVWPFIKQSLRTFCIGAPKRASAARRDDEGVAEACPDQERGARRSLATEP
jgi:hypothetical protein